METVASLRQAGNKVRVYHYRFCQDTSYLAPRRFFKPFPNTISPKGGFTRVYIYTPDGKALVGESFCSIRDAWVRKDGLKFAIERALGERPPLVVNNRKVTVPPKEDVKPF